MNRDVCEHFNPVDLPCDKCKSANVQKSTLRGAAQQALEALEALQGGCTDSNDGTVEAITVWCPEIIDALKAALAEQTSKDSLQVEPVAWRYKGEPWFDGNRWHDKFEVTTDERVAKFKDKHATPLYSAPPQRKPLTEEEIRQIALDTPIGGTNFARAIERAHGIV